MESNGITRPKSGYTFSLKKKSLLGNQGQIIQNVSVYIPYLKKKKSSLQCSSYSKVFIKLILVQITLNYGIWINFVDIMENKLYLKTLSLW